MKKRLIGAVMATVLLVAQATGVFAAGSKVSAPGVVDNSTSKVQIIDSGDIEGAENLTTEEIVEKKAEKDQEVFKAIAESAPEVAEKIVNVNKMINEIMLNAKDGNTERDPEQEKKIVKELVEVVTGMTEEAKAELVETLENKEPLTTFFNTAADNEVELVDGKYDVTFSLPLLTDELKDAKVQILFYDVETDALQLLDPEEIDWTNKEIRFKFEKLGPMAFFADRK